MNFISAALVLLPVRVDIGKPENGKIGLPPLFLHALLLSLLQRQAAISIT
jgi:hypothetical protein